MRRASIRTLTDDVKLIRCSRFEAQYKSILKQLEESPVLKIRAEARRLAARESEGFKAQQTHECCK